MNIPVVPVGDKLLILPIQKQDITLESNLIIGESDLEKGIVISVAKEVNFKLNPFGESIDPGDTVYFPEGKSPGIMIDGKPHLWMQLSDIWGIEKSKE